MDGELEKLIEGINGSEGISCLLCDVNMAWTLEVAHKLGIRGAVLCPSSAAIFALELHMPKLIDDGIMDSTGNEAYCFCHRSIFLIFNVYIKFQFCF